MFIALTRAVSPSIARCELTHQPRVQIDVARAERQHEAYEAALRLAGCRVEHIRSEPDLPDAVFVEDLAIVVDELAVLTRPGVASRRSEQASVAEALARWRSLARVEAPGTLDGGDVLRVERSVWVGVGGRTNEAGFAQLRALLEPLGYHLHPVVTRNCLHLKSAATQVARGTVLINPAWIDPGSLSGLECLEVDPDEPSAANTLLVNGTLFCSQAFARTRARLASHAVDVTPLDLSELAKAEGALTCCSLILSV